MNDKWQRRLRDSARAVLPPAVHERVARVARQRKWIPEPAPPERPFRYPFHETMRDARFAYAPYQWGTLCAAAVAQVLGYERISAIEFGVAGGNGLLELERLAGEASDASGVAIDVYGFDSGRASPSQSTTATCRRCGRRAGTR